MLFSPNKSRHTTTMNLHQTIQTNTPALMITQEIGTRQLGAKKQDHAAQGKYEDENNIVTRWCAVWDGHGNNHAIDNVRKADLDTLMKDPNPCEALHNIILADALTYSRIDRMKSGSTMVYVKERELPTHRELEIGNVGDSQAVVWVNSEIIFLTKPHNIHNGREIERLFRQKRLDPRIPFITQGTNIEVVSPTSLVLKKGMYIRFLEGIELAPSQSIGHDGLTGVEPDVTKLRLELTDSFRVALFTDGVGDVLPIDGPALSSTRDVYSRSISTLQILDEAERRWKQDWTILSPSDWTSSHTEGFPENGYDDCACALLEGERIPSWAKPQNDLVEVAEEIFLDENLPMYDKELVNPEENEEPDFASMFGNSGQMPSFAEMFETDLSNNPFAKMFGNPPGNPMEAIMKIMELLGKPPVEDSVEDSAEDSAEDKKTNI
jgi:serine/threonine protein phosphatase PrpC